MTAHTRAVDARNAHSGGGSIYEAVYAEEAKRAEAAAALAPMERPLRLPWTAEMDERHG